MIEKTSLDGLTEAQVHQKIQLGQVNKIPDTTSRTFKEIFQANVFTTFNATLGILLVVVLIFGSPQDALFGFVLIINSLIGIIQELRAKRTLDRLTAYR